jgi:diguanylate cyclase (GGDEF)-like protein
MTRESEVLKILLEMSKEISSQIPIRTVVRRMSMRLRQLLSADECSIMIMDDSRKELAFSESTGLTRWELENIRFRVGEGIAGWVARHKQAQLVVDCNNDPRFVAVPKQKRPMVSMICVPLLVKRRVIGTVSLTTRTAGQVFDEADLELAVLLSAHISLALENHRLYEISVSDGLTNLYNRRYLEQRLSKELSYARRFRRPLTVLMTDVDFFKKLNDSYGHQAGDSALKVVSETLIAGLRDYDVVARYGGEEFAIVLLATPKTRGVTTAERLRAAVEAASIVFRGQQIAVTISLGVASFPEDADSADDLIDAADKALYEAKRRGRNQVCLYSELPLRNPRKAR